MLRADGLHGSERLGRRVDALLIGLLKEVCRRFGGRRVLGRCAKRRGCIGDRRARRRKARPVAVDGFERRDRVAGVAPKRLLSGFPAWYSPVGSVWFTGSL